MKKVLGLIAASMLLATSALAADAPTYNCDWQPSCEVAPGYYGAMSSPVQSKFNMTVGGFVKLDYAYNSVNFGGPFGALAPNGPIPVRGDLVVSGSGSPTKSAYALKNFNNANEDQSILTARQSRLWFKVNGPTFLGAKTGALIEADFYGDPSTPSESPQMRLRHAYGTMDWANTQVLFGQTGDIFGPAIANTVDFRQGAATGTPNQPRVPQIRLTQKIPFNADNSLKLVIGVQDPNQDKNNNSQLLTAALASTTTGNVAVAQQLQTIYEPSFGSAVNVAGQLMFISKALGAAPGFMGLGMQNLTLGAFGLIGSQKTTDFTNAMNNGHAVDVYGYGLYAFVPILKSKDGKNRAMTMSLEGQAYISAGMAFNSANGNALAAQHSKTGSDAYTTGPPTGGKGYGIYGQIIFYPTQDLGLTAGYGRRNALDYASMNPTPGTAAKGVYEQYNDNLYFNVAYDLNAAVRIAAEYEHLRSQYGGGTTALSDGRFKYLHGIAAGTVGDNGQDNTARLALYYFF
jgi:hypothetical protein